MSLESDVLSRAYGHAVAYLEGLDTRPVATTVGLVELRSRLDLPLQDSPGLTRKKWRDFLPFNSLQPFGFRK